MDASRQIAASVASVEVQYRSSLRRIYATRVSIVSMLELVAGGIIAYFWLGQHLDLWQITGCLCVLAGLTFLQIEKPEITPIE